MIEDNNPMIGNRGLAAEQRLGESEGLWRLALEGVGDGIWDWHVAERRLVFSPRWKELLGYAPDEIGETLEDWEKLVHPDDLADCRQDFQRYLNGKAPVYQNEHRILAKDGSYRWFLDRGTVMERGSGGEPLRVIGTYSEITDHKRLEEAPVAREAHYRAVLETAVEGVIVIDAEGIIQSLSPAAASIFGYRLEDLMGHAINVLMPESHRGEHGQHIRRYLETGDAIGYGRELTGQRQDGTTFPINLSLSRMDLGGRAYFTGLVRDITKLKRSESTQQLINAFYCNSAVLVTDSNNHIIMVNRPFTQMTGYDLHEVIGRNPSILSSGRQDGGFYQGMWRSLNTIGHWQGKLWNRRKNGQEYLESLAISLIYDDKGEVFRHVAVFSEIAASVPLG